MASFAIAGTSATAQTLSSSEIGFIVGSGDDRLRGGGGGDDDEIRGGKGEEDIRGGRGDDTIDGGDDRDTIRGNGGNDTIKGGNDTKKGGSGNDTFIFANRSGHDIIQDFNATANGEKIDLSAVTTIRNFTQLSNATSQVGADVLIDTGGNNSILLLGVDLADLGNGDFIF